MRCMRFKKVKMKGNGMVRRCAKYSGRKRRAGGYRKRSAAKRRASGGYRRGHRPFNKGKRCVAWQTNRRGIRSCASYGGRPRRARGAASQPSSSQPQWWHNMQTAMRGNSPYHAASSASPYSVEPGSWHNRQQRGML